MATKSSGMSSGAVMRIAFGAFFIVLGITGIIPQAGEGIFSLSKGQTPLEIVFGIVELACGLFLLLDAFRRMPGNISKMFLLVILLFWLARIVVTDFVQAIDLTNRGIIFKPTFWSWLLTLTTEVALASGLWALYKSE